MDVGLYVHVPFCPTKCGYCDFYSRDDADAMMPALVAALLRELDARVEQDSHQVETIFVGGGTPTHLPPAELGRLFDGLGEVADRCGVCEFSVEANPGSLTRDKARILRDRGVNRISLGAQSFMPQELHRLERVHQPVEIEAAAALVHDLEFAHFNLDLIFGIPGQSQQTWSESLHRALELGPDHLSCYGLTYEPGTPLHARMHEGQVEPVEESLEADLYLQTIDTLTAAGFEHYEISNWARPTGRCRHNLRYWYQRPGIGIGPAAASYLEGRRWRNVPDLADYIHRVSAGQSSAIECETLSPRARAGEAAMLGLRLVEGIDIREFARRTGYNPMELFGDPIRRHQAAGHVFIEQGRIRLTRTGLLLADVVAGDLLLPDDV